MDQVSRRGLIATVAAVFAMRFAPRMSSNSVAGLVSDTHPLFAVCSDLKCPDAIGMACLKTLPVAEASPDVLVSLIVQRAAPQISERTSSNIVRRLVRAQSRRDFRNGSVRNVDGWTLSVTEIRMYALTTLLANAATQNFSNDNFTRVKNKKQAG